MTMATFSYLFLEDKLAEKTITFSTITNSNTMSKSALHFCLENQLCTCVANPPLRSAKKASLVIRSPC